MSVCFSEMLYEDQGFKHRNLSALVASKVNKSLSLTPFLEFVFLTIKIKQLNVLPKFHNLRKTKKKCQQFELKEVIYCFLFILTGRL